MTPSRFAASCAATFVLVGSVAAQRPAPAPARARPAAARPDTARRDTAAVKDSVSKFLESFTYRSLGPAAYSGRVTALAVPNSREPRPKTWYIGAAGGGVWKTTNGGITWQSVSSGLGSETVGDLAVAPSDSNILWVGTGEKNSLRSQYWGDGVYKSTDGGKSWTRMGLADTRAIGRIIIHPTGPDTVYVAALGHLAPAALGRQPHGRRGQGQRALQDRRRRQDVEAAHRSGAEERPARRSHWPHRHRDLGAEPQARVRLHPGGSRRHRSGAGALRRRVPLRRRRRYVDAGQRPAGHPALLLRRDLGRRL